jgi:hypothetical protein
MKTKPDLSDFQRPALATDPAAFLDGAEADRAENQAGAKAPKGGKGTAQPTVQKLFRLRADVAAALKITAAERSAVLGRRVTEQEIVEQLLCDHLKLSR